MNWKRKVEKGKMKSEILRFAQNDKRGVESQVFHSVENVKIGMKNLRGKKRVDFSPAEGVAKNAKRLNLRGDFPLSNF